MDLKLPFGLKNGQLFQVSDVESGLGCDCICPDCKHPLIARKGKRKIHHFSHYKHPECEHAFETGLHLFAKKVIKEAGYILLPELACEIVVPIGRSVFEASKFHSDEIYLERRINDIVPDVMLEKDGQTLCIEIYVTHEVDEQKREKIKESKLPTIEIDLSKIDRTSTIDFDLLKDMIVNSVENKRWLFNLELYNLENEIISNSIERKTKNWGFVDNCPRFSRRWRGELVENIISCNGCPHRVYSESERRGDRLSGPNEGEHVVACFGHKTDEEINILLRSKDKVPYTIYMNPFCPSCHQWMILREAKRGSKVGSKFWGCRNYPTCKLTLSVS